jgi:predicted nucleic acid-binding protein
MKVYVDSSVLIRFLFREPGQVRDWGQWTLAMTSEFTRVEVSRAVERVGVLGQVSAAELGELSRDAASLFDPMHMLPLEELVLKRAAGRFPTVISAGDAIHLASALLWQHEAGESLTLLTHDRQLRTAALACGLQTGE